jgi:flagellar hook assembly protein FlgD
MGTSTTIHYDVPSGMHEVTLEIFDTGGRLVRRLVDGRQAGGRRQVSWDCSSVDGAPVASGVYYCRLRVGTDERLRKMTVLR